MLVRRLVIVLIVLGVLLGAFLVLGRSSNPIVGKWSGEIPAGGQSIKMTFDFKRDGTLIQKMETPKGPMEATGTWRTDGGKVTFHADKVMGDGVDVTEQMPQGLKSWLNTEYDYTLADEKLTLTHMGSSATFTSAP